jgi:hypothetical protein
MRLTSPGRPHLTYCTNVHPGESWDEVRAALLGPVATVARSVAGNEAFGVGLRISGRAAHELQAPNLREELSDVLRRTNTYVFTINGFPFGRFHGEPVKERVYRPDWRERERLVYTKDLVDLLASVLPDGVTGSISTVPGGFGPRARLPADERAIADVLIEAAAYLVESERRTGRRIILALEPEPACLLESGADAAAFFRDHLFDLRMRTRFATLIGTDVSEAEVLLRRHLGVCLDACHLAVGFEPAASAIASVAGEGIAIAKIQVSAGVEVEGAEAAREVLPSLDDGVYLHQTCVATPSGTVRKYLDLPNALRDPVEGVWRVHAHVPVDRDPPRPLATTHRELAALLRHVREREVTSHFEVETYTWNVLPPHLRGEDLVADVARELRWTRAMLENG